MAYRDELTAALERIEELRGQLRAAEQRGEEAAELRDRVVALERTLAELRARGPAPATAPPEDGKVSERAAPRAIKFTPTAIVAAVAFLPLMVLVPSGSYGGEKAEALLLWTVGCLLLPAGTALLSLGTSRRGLVLLALGALAYAGGWHWTRGLGVVKFGPFG